ncbi:hypothetical protein F0L74_09970 [Chitinophaga agrisoli]|uniref:Uncharacterized protein n=1 Tax=Chitinophaga agrisoli TaxID=2607653 RepID=A0A5B2VUU8_9BACT|nr:hypothetical protein [Chitinophaga agrisoli]KAA2242845.1 hypothetical protein F0L74_09970 [Chitinophaga agrisoli]
MSTAIAKINGGSLMTEATFSAGKLKSAEEFLKKLNEAPPENELKPTPDGRARTLPISFVQMKLDEIYIGQWGTTELRLTQIGNEIIGNLVLWVIHPITGLKIERPGTAAVQITVDAVPAHLKFDKGDSPELTAQKNKDRNSWALDMQNKKPNALYLAAPKLKSEALKNAAATLGKVFGRDINRKLDDVDNYESIYTDEIQVNEVKAEVEEKFNNCTTQEALAAIWTEYKALQSNPQFKKLFSSKKAQLSFK